MASGYQWNVTYLSIGVGDVVNWSWNLPTTLTGLSIRVEQVDSPISTTRSGFSSGNSVAQGKFVIKKAELD
jgi:hypothetical protein